MNPHGLVGSENGPGRSGERELIVTVMVLPKSKIPPFSLSKLREALYDSGIKWPTLTLRTVNQVEVKQSFLQGLQYEPRVLVR